MSNLALQLIEKEKKEKTGYLDLGHTGLTPDNPQLPEVWKALGELVHLEVLIFSNQWYDWNEKYGAYEYRLSQNTGSKNLLDKIPESLMLLINLKKLVLAGHENDKWVIKKIENLNRLTYLRHFDISNNKINDLEHLDSLNKLQYLDVSSNQINKLKGLDNLIALQHFDISQNQISKLKGLENLGALRRFNINNNKINKLKSLSILNNLQYLYIENNRIRNLENLGSLNTLKNLSIGDNEIVNIQPLIPFLKRKSNPLRVVVKGYYSENETGEINVHGNPISTPPLEIIKQGNKAIIRYFQELETEQNIPLREAKLLIIGAGGVGKTSLMVKLQDPENKLPESDETTVGITVTQQPKTYKIDGEEHTLNIWDFGGQDIYHPTHQFFLTKNSIYVLMQDGREQKTDFYYWLQVQKLLADDSPLFIVQNIKDNSRCAIPVQELKGKFDNIKEYFEIDLSEVCAGHKGFEDIIIELKAKLQKLPHIGEVWPKTRYDIRDALLQLKDKHHISLKDYQAICDKHNYTDPQAQKELLRQLHFLGVVLHFEDTPYLDDMVITNPQWATDAVYAILDHTEKHDDKKGHFNWSDVKTVWHEAKYQGVYPQILNLMNKFELSFELPDQKHHYIAPLLLPDDKPDYKWDTNNKLQMQYSYDFMPKGILARLIVRMHKYIKDRLFWKRGVVLELDATLAQITEDYSGRNLSISVSGRQAKELIYKVFTEIDSINKTYHFSERIKAIKLIPCNCGLCARASSPHFYDYKVLRKRIDELRKKTIECPDSAEDVLVKELLDNITPSVPFGAKKIFISYSHKDIAYRKEFESRLKPLLRQQKIKDIWHDHEITAGQNWDKEIEHNLKTADIIVLLISDDFWASDYIYEKELAIAKERYQAGDCIVLPIIVRVNSYWEGSEWAAIQGIPTDPKTGKLTAIHAWSDKDEAWACIVAGIRDLL